MSLSAGMMIDIAARRREPVLLIVFAFLVAAAAIGCLSGAGEIDPATTIYP